MQLRNKSGHQVAARDNMLDDEGDRDQVASTAHLSKFADREADTDQIEIFVWQSFEQVTPVWHKLEADGICYPYQSFAWQICWHETMGQADEILPQIVVVAVAGYGPVMLIPLGIQTKFGLRHLRFMADNEYNAPLLDPDFAKSLSDAKFAAIWSAILKKLPPVDVIRLNYLTNEFFGVTNPFASLPNLFLHNPTYLGALDGPFEALNARKTGKARQTAKARRRRLEKVGSLKFYQADSMENGKRILAETIQNRVDKKRADPRRNDEMRAEEFQQFHWRLTEYGLPSGFVHLSALMVDDAVTATHWGVVFRGHYYWLSPTYDRSDKWGVYSPGRVLLECIVEWACSQGLTVFDAGPGEHDYKASWCDKVVNRYGYIKAQTIKGSLFVVARKSAMRVKKALKYREKLYNAFGSMKQRFVSLRSSNR